VREWVEWVKHNLPIYTAPLPPSLLAKSKTAKFSLQFSKKSRPPAKKKRRENFAVFETRRRLVRKPAQTKLNFGKKFELSCIFEQNQKPLFSGGFSVFALGFAGKNKSDRIEGGI
jgi:hypothetical protein